MPNPARNNPEAAASTHKRPGKWLYGLIAGLLFIIVLALALTQNWLTLLFSTENAVVQEAGLIELVDISFNDADDLDWIDFSADNTPNPADTVTLEGGYLRLDDPDILWMMLIPDLSPGQLIHYRLRTSISGPCFRVALVNQAAGSAANSIHVNGCPDQTGGFEVSHSPDHQTTHFESLSGRGEVTAAEGDWREIIIGLDPDGERAFLVEVGTASDGQQFAFSGFALPQSWQADAWKSGIDLFFEGSGAEQFLEVDQIRIMQGSMSQYLLENFPAFADQQTSAEEYWAGDLPTCTLAQADAAGPTAVPTPTPIPVISELGDFPLPELTHPEMLTELEDGVYHVEWIDGYDENFPPSPRYIWQINQPQAHPGLHEIVIEFDLLETSPEWDFGWFGYERGYFLNLHHLMDDISIYPLLYEGDEPYGDIGGIDAITADSMLNNPAFGVDLGHTVEQDGQHFTAAIPLALFRGGHRQLVLQFLPGATFGNVEAHITHDGSADPSDISSLLQPYEEPTWDLNDVYPDWWSAFGGCPNPDDIYSCLRQSVYRDIGTEGDGFPSGPRSSDDIREIYANTRQWVWQDVERHLVNPDGTTNMAFAEYDLDPWMDELAGDYGVVPEGLMYVLGRLEYGDFMSQESAVQLKAELVDFLFREMQDPDTGLIRGIWDNDQQKLVAGERRGANLPLWSVMNGYGYAGEEIGVIEQAQLNEWLIDILAHEFTLVGEKYYYTPRGVTADGMLELHLEDFAFAPGMYETLYQIALADPGTKFSMPDPETVVRILEGISNSLKLYLEQQALTPTHLPAEQLWVHFDAQGGYSLEFSETFSIANDFFAIVPAALAPSGSSIGWLAFKLDDSWPERPDIDMSDHYPAQASILRQGTNVSADRWYAALRQARAAVGEYYYLVQLFSDTSKMLYQVYSFALQQPAETALAPAYNIHTGAPVWGSGSPDAEPGSWDSFRRRFGSLASAGSWFQVAGRFGDARLHEVTLSLQEIGFGALENRLLADCEGNHDCIYSMETSDFAGLNFSPVTYESGSALTGAWAAEFDTYIASWGAHNYAWRERVESWAELERLLDQSDGFMGRKLRGFEERVPGFRIP